MSGAHVEGEKMRRGRQSERENLQYVCVWDKTGIRCVRNQIKRRIGKLG